jgi:hypothetical protein
MTTWIEVTNDANGQRALSDFHLDAPMGNWDDTEAGVIAFLTSDEGAALRAKVGHSTGLLTVDVGDNGVASTLFLSFTEDGVECVGEYE